jgi:hypothetical protein
MRDARAGRVVEFLAVKEMGQQATVELQLQTVHAGFFRHSEADPSDFGERNFQRWRCFVSVRVWFELACDVVQTEVKPGKPRVRVVVEE